MAVVGRREIIIRGQRPTPFVALRWMTSASKSCGSPCRASSRASDLGKQLTESDWIFTYDGTNPINPDTVTHYVKAWRQGSGWIRTFTRLRHFAATQMIGGGTDVRTVAGRLGHKDASTTLRVYSHALPERDRDAAGLLGRALSG